MTTKSTMNVDYYNGIRGIYFSNIISNIIKMGNLDKTEKTILDFTGYADVGEYDAQDNNSSGTATADVDMDSEALQISYSMGGMSISAYQMETSNPGWDSNATKHSASEISIGLAF